MPDTKVSRRRSQRGQPISVQLESRTAEKKCTLIGPIIYSRQSIASDFLKTTPAADESDEDGDDALTGVQTHFYASFTSPGKNKKDQDKVYKVGDPVQIKRELGRHSLGIIVSLWKTDNEEEDTPPLARVHLFLQQKDLPKTMASRDVEKVSTTLTGY